MGWRDRLLGGMCWLRRHRNYLGGTAEGASHVVVVGLGVKKKKVPAQELRLENEEASRLSTARMELVMFAMQVLGIVSLPVMMDPPVATEETDHCKSQTAATRPQQAGE